MNTDDPKFTAHVLGELEDLTPAERAEIEALLASDPAAAAEAGETRALAARLRAELPGEEAAAPREEQRTAVLSAVDETAPAAKIVRFPRRLKVLAAIAACLAIAVSAVLLFPSRSERQDVALENFKELPLMSMPPPVPATPGLKTAAPVAKAFDAKSGVPSDPLFMPTADAAPAPQPSALTPPIQSPGSDSSSGIVAPSPLIASNSPGVAPLLPAGVPAGEAQAKDRLDAAKEPQGTLQVPKSVPATVRSATPALGNGKGVFQGATSAAASTAVPAEAYSGMRTKDSNIHWSQRRQRFMIEQPASGEERPTTAEFENLPENGFFTAREHPLSTFSIDVDTASYSIVRRSLNANQVPPEGSVRIEEMLNYFSYNYPPPQGDAPFSATMEVAACPWAIDHRLVRIGLKGREIASSERPPSNLIFLIDVSGSMDMPNKLPLLKQCFGLLIDQLGPKDQVAIVVYAGESGCVLEPTHDKEKMRDALRQLHAEGSTNGASGLQMAYKIADKSFIKGGTNRVILATDGDWNVGVTDHGELMDMIARKAKSGVFLTALGFGVDNLKDRMLVNLADHGNGHYAYIDTLLEAKKVFVEQLTSTLMTIAKDVKIQVEFNPAQVAAYRLVGYEKRALAKEDFNNDRKDAGEIGAGHTVTALYEVVPAGQELAGLAQVDALKYQPNQVASAPEPDAPTPAEPRPEKSAPSDATRTATRNPAAGGGAAAAAPALPPAVHQELLTLKLRYKAPDGDTSKLLEFALTDRGATWEKSSPDFRFAAAVAGYGMLLRESSHQGDTTWDAVTDWAQQGLGPDASGYRKEFLSLIEKAKGLSH